MAENKFPKTHAYSVSNNKMTPVEIYDADFETAISATKFGKFNIMLLFVSFPAAISSVFETTTMSYVVPAAHCDLNLSLNDKGFLNAITFLGMISSGFVWGFLCDTFGRKKLLVIGYLLDAILVVLSSFSQSFIFLMVFKFLGGFIINGPFAALAAYLSEFHCSKYRPRIQLVRGIIVSTGTMILPLLAWATLARDINLTLFNGNFKFHSWNLYILVCAIPSICSTIIFWFLPESPKFLMTMGRNKEALEVFKRVFSRNTGINKEEFPIKSLVDETKLDPNATITANRNKIQALREGFHQVKHLCLPPYVKNAFIVCALQTLIMLSLNTLRLWLPQIFQSISDYEYLNNKTTASLCTMLTVLNPADKNSTCFVNFSPSVYTNTITVSVVTILGYIAATTIINKVGQKLLLSGLALIAGTFAIFLYFAQTTLVVLVLSSLSIALGAVCTNLVLQIVIDLFPTFLRTFAISLVMMLGRAASMVGNLIFPLLLSLGCAPAFISIGATVISGGLLAILLPKSDLKTLR